MDVDEDVSENVWTYLTLCGEPTIYEGLKFAKDLILANILFRFILQFNSVPVCVRHFLSLIIGAVLLYINTGFAFIWTIIISYSAYFIMFAVSKIIKKHTGLIVSTLVISFLMFSEVIIVNPKMWQQIRGIQMIAAMKIIAIAIELDRGLFKTFLNPIEFGGYILCPANTILGPWISYHNYRKCLEPRFLHWRWFKIIILNLILAITFLLFSNCIVPWYIDDDYSNWFVAYRDAQAFRMSHYFVSSMSMVSMFSAGFGLTNDCHSELLVTNPFYIELPRSLVQVVTYWNMPMHQWLKSYIFKTCQPNGHFFAILVTYIVSSLLHGLNFQLSAVLLSIGLFSYVEYNFRNKVAAAFDVCCSANACSKHCNHKLKKNSVVAILFNTIFSILTLVHLAYLGVMFEASFSVQEIGYSYYHTLQKWENLGFFSHWFLAFMYFINIMV